MRNTTKRLLSLVMVIALMLTLAPLSVFAAGTGTTVYLKPNSNWTQGNAWFAAYYWNSGNNWVKLTDTDGDGIYEGVIPDGYTNVIFCRMNPATTALDWSSKWDQTVDLTLDGTNNCFTVGDGQWNNATGTWSVHTPAGGDDTEESESTEATTQPSGGTTPTGNYTLIGYINGADNGHGDDWEGTGYPFVDGKVTVTITETSYVYVKTTDNANWYMTESFVTTTSGTFKNTSTGADEKMQVPAGEVTFTLVENADGTLGLSYTVGSSGGNEGGEGGDVGGDTGDVGGDTGLTGDFYLIGYINGADHGDATDSANLGDYKFVDGKVTATFTQASYVCIKTGTGTWYMTDGWLGTTVTSATLYNTSSLGTDANKLHVPAGTATFTLVDNGDDTYTLSYTTDGSSGGGDVGGGDEEGGSDVPSDGTIPTGDYYLFGYIDSVDYGVGDDYATLGKYKFVNGSLTTTFPSDSYVGVKNAAGSEWFQTKGWLGAKTAVVLYDSSKVTFSGTWDKMFVPGGVELTFSLRKNDDGTMTLSYVRNEVKGVQDTSGVQDGMTLHCWNWSYNNIAANMKAISDAGYTAIQTSPAQVMKEATVGGYVDHWWVFYQPVDFKMNTSADNALGTKAEFTAMCEVADQYGIKVIVDVVANHLGNQTGNDLSSAIPSYLLNTAYWHDYSQNIASTDYSNGDRYAITHKCMGGLPDLNTANKDIQNYVLTYLKECIDAGADGFRFDATKHIETPYDDDGTASDFWPTVIGGAEAYAKQKGFDLYCYGELLDEPGKKVSIVEYTEFLAVTDNSWGNCLRGEIAGGSASYNLKGYNKAAAPNQLVLWAESHDTYGNDDKVSTNISVANINKTWALVAARADVMGLYLARPANFSASGTKLGEASLNTGWANPEVKAVNEFHNAFVGTTEKAGNSDGIAYVVRGDSGVVLVNYQGTTKSVSGLAVGMADGTYTDQITGNTFTVSNGNISGSIGSTGIAVVYNAEEEHEHDYEATVTPPTCTEDGYTTYTCSGCGDSYVSDEVPATDHNYVDGTCSACGAADPDYKPDDPIVTDYYLFGYINGANYGCDEDYENMGEYKFVDGTLTVTFAETSYVAVKTTGNADWYMTDGWLGTETTTATLYNTNNLGTDANKLYVPGGVEVTFTVVRNADDTLTLSYTVAEEEKFDIDFAQVILGNALNVNFAFPVDAQDDWTGAYAVATKTYADGREDLTVTVPATEWKSATIQGAKHYYFSFSNVSGKEMADNIYVTIYNADDEAISNEYTESIRSYVMRILDDQDAATRTMLVDMLNYGSAAQASYTYGTDNLANSLLSETQKAYGSSTVKTCTDSRVQGAKYQGTRLVLKNSILMQFGFSGLTADMTAKVEFTNHRGTKISETVAPVKLDNGAYAIEVNQIVAADGRIPVTVTVYNADGTVYGTATDSMESYIARMGTTDPLYAAIMMFSDAAYAYLHK